MSHFKADLVCFGELIWDMLPTGKVAGGAPFNIVNRARALGLDSEIVGSVGNDNLGDEFFQIVKELGNSTRFLQRHPTLPTSQALVSLGPNGEAAYEIVHPVAWDDIQINDSVIELVKHCKSFVFSSLALRDARSREALFQLLPHASLKICDINLRSGHFQKDTILRMLDHTDILRMNEDELEMICGWMNIGHLEVKEQIKEIARHYQYQIVIATLGSKGAIGFQNGIWYEQPVFKVDVKDTVGAGDAFLAAFIHQYLAENTMTESLEFACAIGALTASKNGGTPVILEEEIVSILKR